MEKPKFPPAKVEEKPKPLAKPEPPKEGDDFKNSLAAMIGRGKPGTIKKPKLAEPPKPVVYKKVNIFEDEEEK